LSVAWVADDATCAAIVGVNICIEALINTAITVIIYAVTALIGGRDLGRITHPLTRLITHKSPLTHTLKQATLTALPKREALINSAVTIIVYAVTALL
jgi:hypothetical protein